MKASTRRILAAVIVVILTVTVALAIVVARFFRESATLRPIASQKITDSIWVIRDRNANCYLVTAGNDAIVIDACNGLESVRDEMQTLGLDPASVKAVFLTHSDADHTGALKLFPKAVVRASKAEEPMVTGRKNRFLFIANTLDVPVSYLADGEEVRVGGITVRGIDTPGHTPGAMCYVVNGRFLFTGDALSLRDGVVAPFNDLFNMDTNTAVKSLAHLADLPGVTHIFTAHYGFTDNYRSAVRHLRR